MKIRSATIAMCLGCLLYFLPAVIAQLRNLQPSNLSISNEHPTQNAAQRPRAAGMPVARPVTLANREVTSVDAETTDLLIHKSSTPTLVKAGEALTYTIVVTNTGTVPAQNLIILDTLPRGVRFQGNASVKVTNGNAPQLAVSTETLTVTVGSLQPTGNIHVVGRTVVESSASGTTLQNTALVTSTNDSTPGNNEGSVETFLITATPTTMPTPTETAAPATTPPQSATPTATHTPTSPPPTATPAHTTTATPLPDLANLQISKAVAPNPVQAGALVTYTLRIGNPGPGVAQDVVIRDILPKGLFFEGLSSLSVAHGEGPQLLLSSAELTGTVTSLKVGGIITITAPARTHITGASDLLTNEATVTSITPETQRADNQATTVLFLLALPLHKSYLPVIQQ